MRVRVLVGLLPLLLVPPPAALAVPSAAPAAPPAAAEAPGRAVVVLPVDGPLVRLFDAPESPYAAGHRGVDLAAWPGTPVRAALPGTVTFSGLVAGRGWVTVDHGGGLETTYGVLSPRLVGTGRRVRAGDVVGRVAAGAVHVDWGAKRDDAYVDPLTLLGRWDIHLSAGGSQGGAGPPL